LDGNSGLTGDAGLIEIGSTPDAQAEGGGLKEIEIASSVGQGRLDPLDAKIHPRRKPEDAKFEDRRGFIIDPTVDADSGQPEEAKTDRREIEIRGNPEGRQSATLNDRRFRETWRIGQSA